MQFGDPVKVVIVGQDRALELAGQDDQFVIHFAHAFNVDVADAYHHRTGLLQLGQYFHAAPSPLAAQVVG